MPTSQFSLHPCPLYPLLSLCIHSSLLTAHSERCVIFRLNGKQKATKHKFYGDILMLRLDPWQLGPMSRKRAGDTYLMWVVEFLFWEPRGLYTSCWSPSANGNASVGIKAKMGLLKVNRTSETWQYSKTPPSVTWGCEHVGVHRCSCGCWCQGLTAVGRIYRSTVSSDLFLTTTVVLIKFQSYSNNQRIIGFSPSLGLMPCINRNQSKSVKKAGFILLAKSKRFKLKISFHILKF